MTDLYCPLSLPPLPGLARLVIRHGRAPFDPLSVEV